MGVASPLAAPCRSPRLPDASGQHGGRVEGSTGTVRQGDRSWSRRR